MVPTSRNCEAWRSEILPLDAGAAGGGGVKEHVDEVSEQVDLVDVEDAPVAAASSPGANASMVAAPARTRGTSRLPVTRSSVAPRGSSTRRAGRRSAAAWRVRFVRAARVGVGRVAGEAAAGDHVDAGQDVGQASPGSSWRCPSRR